MQDFGNYDQHAPKARADVELLHSRRGDILAQAVGTATGQLLGSVREELQAVKTQLSTQEVTLRHTLIMVQDLCTTLSNTVQQSVSRQASGNQVVLDELINIRLQQEKLQIMLEERGQHIIRRQQIDHQRENIVYTGGVDDSVEVLGIDDVETKIDDTLIPTNCNDTTISYATQQARIAGELDMNAFDLLLRSPRLPACSLKFPKTWHDLHEEWKNNDLESFVKCKQHLWNDPILIQKFSKRLRAIKIMRRMKTILGNGRLNDVEVINILDFNRLRDHGNSISKHIHHLFTNDNTITRRNRIPRQIINHNNNQNNL